MKFTTELKAIDPKDGELKTWSGPHIDALSWSHAEEVCQMTGRGYLKVTGQFVCNYGEDREDLIFWN